MLCECARSIYRFRLSSSVFVLVKSGADPGKNLTTILIVHSDKIIDV